MQSFNTHLDGDPAHNTPLHGPQPFGAGGSMLMDNTRGGGAAGCIAGTLNYSDQNPIGATAGSYGWEGIFTTKFTIDQAGDKSGTHGSR